MRTSLGCTGWRVLLWLALMIAPVRTPATKPPAGEDIFRDGFIPEVELVISREGLASLGRSPRKYVAATLREGQHLYTNVAVHLKGSIGSFRQLQDKPALTLNFDRLAPGQTFHGLKKIHLNNSVQDRSYLHEKISRELFEAADVPAPRAGNAWVTLNQRELGLYVLLEGVNKQFLKRYFKDVTGNVYDGSHAGNDVTGDLPTNCGENRRDKSRLRALARAGAEPDLGKRLAALDETLDRERFISFVAVEMILAHWDGYTIGRNNYRVYHDRDSDRMVFLPHGLDQVLNRRFPSMLPENISGFVARSLLDIPSMRQRYRERYAELATNVFEVDGLTNRIHTLAANIGQVMARHNSPATGEQAQAAARFARRIKDRAAELQRQLTPIVTVDFDGIGVARLTNWNSRIDMGEAQLDHRQDSNERDLLYIGTRKGCTASWRTSLALPAGEYRFMARIKTKGVVLAPDDQRSGAGLRISGHRVGQKNGGDRDWVPVSFDFSVPENRSEIELVCELRASKGEIWYEHNSLKIIRK